jgi:FSR family fosmidomycin resistance protein-like MFS transporter
MATSARAADPRVQSLRVIGLVGTAHGVSHFFQYVLPPLFPILTVAFGVGYEQLGWLVTLFYVSSGLAQTPWGFAVDRFGGRAVLMTGIGLFAGALLLIGLCGSYWATVPLIILAGIGNSVFHPADYAMLGAGVSKDWMARAYGVHQLGGNIGWAAAPLVSTGLAGLFGWQIALVILGLFGFILLAFVWWQGKALAVGDARPRAAREAPNSAAAPLRLLLSAPIILCFAYFALLATALTGFQSFLPSALHTAFGTLTEIAGTALTGFFLGGAVGILVGGWLADRSRRHERILAAGLFIAALLVLIVGLVPLSLPALIAVVAAAGFFSGMTAPSRDMMVRGATPPGATGKVFGFVYSGLDLGSALVPPALGAFIDHGAPLGVFVTTASALGICIFIAHALQRAATRQQLGRAAVGQPAE